MVARAVENPPACPMDKQVFVVSMPAMRFTVPVFCCLCTLLSAAPDAEKKPDAPDKAARPEEAKAPVVKEAIVEIAGKQVPYKVSAAKIQLKQDDGKPRASIFHVSYERTDVKDPTERPVMFAFNGGPGSSAVWLHLGVLGPKIVRLPGNGTQAPEPPARVVDNPLSILDVCDLVFIDPVSTGYSRTEGESKPGEFHGVNGDIESVGDFIRRWVTEHDRWASPKYLIGESYGGIRAAGLSQFLQSRYGMSLNGVVLLSTLLDFATLSDMPGNDLTNLVYLPSYTGTAHFHGKIKGDRDALIEKSRAYAFGEYASALLKGSSLSDAERKQVAAKLAELTGIAAKVWSEHDLRISPTFFRGELLRAEGKVIGRFDARVAWDTTDPSNPNPEYDPSFSLALGAFSTSLMDYMGRELGWEEDRPYEILTGKVQPWSWDAQNSVVNVGDRLANALRDNPHLRVLVMGGHTDLATPPEGVAYSLRHLPGLARSARDNIRTAYYDGGHMFYLNPPDLEKTRSDLVKFLETPKH